MPDTAKGLVVEDDPECVEYVIRPRLARFLEVVDVPSHYDALPHLGDPSVAIVVIDYGLPGDDGLTTLAEVRAVRPEVPAVIFSQHLTSVLCNKATAHAAFWLTKTDPDVLLVHVQSALARFHAMPAVARRRVALLQRRWNLTDRRTAILLRWAEGASYTDLAEEFGIGIDGVKYHLHGAAADVGAHDVDDLRQYVTGKTDHYRKQGHWHEEGGPPAPPRKRAKSRPR